MNHVEGIRLVEEDAVLRWLCGQRRDMQIWQSCQQNFASLASCFQCFLIVKALTRRKPQQGKRFLQGEGAIEGAFSGHCKISRSPIGSSSRCVPYLTVVDGRGENLIQDILLHLSVVHNFLAVVRIDVVLQPATINRVLYYLATQQQFWLICILHHNHLVRG